MFTMQFVDREAILGYIVALTHPLDPAAISFIPYHTPIPQSTRLVRATVLLEAATFGGSGAITPAVWGGTYRDGNDNVFKDSQLLEWICSADPLTPETIYGVIIDNGVTVMIDVFDTPQVIQRAGDAIRRIVTVPYGG